MDKLFSGITPLIYPSAINVPYRWWVGETAGAFFVALRDEKKIKGTYCSNCRKTYVPPRKTCPACFQTDMTWTDVSDTGSLISFTVARKPRAALKREIPVIFGLIRPDGADTGLLHYLSEVEPDRVRIGMRVQARFSEKRSGSLMDIEYFKPI